MSKDIISITTWWFTFFVLSLSVWPIVWVHFHKFFDRAYSLSRIFGLAAVGVLVWFFGHIKLLPFTPTGISLIIFALFAISFYLIYSHIPEFISWHRRHFRIILFEEILFFVSLLFWSYIRAHQPDVEGLEKFMDFGFMNSALKGASLPPLDMWWAGSPINYYYFGHYLAGLLAKLSRIEPSVAYNLSISHIFALSMGACFSLSANLVFSLSSNFKKQFTSLVIPVSAGLLAALLVNLGGNLHTLYAFFSPYPPEDPIAPWTLDFQWSPDGYWYPNATRFIKYTIHEFPIYSYVVADLHGHVSDIPFVLLFLSLLLNLFISTTPQSKFKLLLPHLLIQGTLLGVMLMTNYWDFAIYGLLFAVSHLFLLFPQKPLVLIKQILPRGLTVLLTALAVTSPFLLSFQQIAEGVDFVKSRSPLYQLLILYGWPLLVSLIAIFSFRKSLSHTASKLVLSFISTAWLLILLPEIIYVKDIYIADYHRANTMFKLVYQSFILFSIVAPFILVNFFLTRKSFNKILFVSFSTLASISLILLAIYPVLSIRSYYGNLKTYKGLYGMSFLDSTPGDLAAINWFNQQVQGQPVILEAPGDSYTIYNRVSAMTGLPTVVGWAVHEWLWRGSYDPVGARISEVEQIYTSPDPQITISLLDKYSVKYVIIGQKEQEKYGNKLDENKFYNLGSLVFSQDNTRIYLINN